MSEEAQGLGGELNTPAPSVGTPGVIEVPGVGQVSLDEVVKGYMRQQDYTQKTQSLSQEREKYGVAADLLDALENDPTESIKALMEAYEVNLGTTTTPSVNTESSITTAVDDELPAYVKQELEENRKFRETIQQKQLREEIEREISDCKTKYGDFDEAAVVQFAVTRGIPDIEVAYLAWDNAQAFEKGKEAGVRDANARVEATVEGASTGRGSAKPVDSYEEAIQAALDSMPSS